MAYSEKLGTNRGFELGDSSQFSITGGGTNGLYTTSVGEGSNAWQLYADLNQMAAGDESEEILTDPVAAVAGQTYLVGMVGGDAGKLPIWICVFEVAGRAGELLQCRRDDYHVCADLLCGYSGCVPCDVYLVRA